MVSQVCSHCSFFLEFSFVFFRKELITNHNLNLIVVSFFHLVGIKPSSINKAGKTLIDKKLDHLLGF